MSLVKFVAATEVTKPGLIFFSVYGLNVIIIVQQELKLCIYMTLCSLLFIRAAPATASPTLKN